MINLSDILSERLAIVGGTGSGKSYTARGLVEKVLHARGRVGVIDPTGVWNGLRVNADGKSPGFPVVIFGGDRSDVPLVETAGRVVAQAVATTHQSWIIDTSALKTKAAERRFMLDFLDALFETNREDITLVVDEADRFSPQRMSPEVARLHERMEEIVRRGRVRGFTPWLITQRPASLNKDVLSQATAMICMRMTGAHDRGAMADVIEGQADKATAREIINTMPNHKTGNGLVWAPQRGILQAVHFPKIVTLDTMRAPRPGERRTSTELPPIDLGALREKLATVQEEAKANDPTALKAEIRRLTAELAKGGATVDHDAITQARQSGLMEGLRKGSDQAAAAVRTMYGDRIKAFLVALDTATKALLAPMPALPAIAPTPGITHRPAPFVPQPSTRIAVPSTKPSVEGVNGPMQRILDALAWWEAVGINRPSKVQVAVVANYSPGGGAFNNPLGRLRSMGFIEPAIDGAVSLMALGRDAANAPETPPTTEEMHKRAMAILNGPQQRILAPLLAAYPRSMNKEALAAEAGYSPDGGAFNNPLGSLRSLGFIDYPSRGQVVALPILFVE